MTAPKSENIVWHKQHVSKESRASIKGQKPALDGDNVRYGLNSNLGFSPEDRSENIRRIGEVAKLFVDSGTLVITAFISPYQADRQRVRDLVEDGEFLEVFVDTPLEICEQRDPKGLYKKARAGDIKGFTGIDAPYEAPVNAEITLSTASESIEESVAKVCDYLKSKGYLA